MSWQADSPQSPTPYPFNFCSNSGRTYTSIVRWTSGHEVEYVHSTSLVEQLIHCMVLATVMQLSFRVLAILL